MKRYRIKEIVFDDNRSEFFPEIYNKELKYVMDRPAFWSNFSEKSYKTYDDAMIQTKAHKENKKPFGENIVEVKIHEID